MNDQAEKRGVPRVEVQMSVDVRTKYIYTTASVLNISKTGLFIKTANPLPDDSELDIVMHFDRHENPMNFKGVVKWGRRGQRGTAPAGMGVQLIDPDLDLLDTLAEEIQRTPKNI